MCVLVEASRQEDESKTQRIWDLLADLYKSNSTLSELSEDRRRSHAAKLIVTAWKARQTKADPQQNLQKPDFVHQLEILLTGSSTEQPQTSSAGVTQQSSTEPGLAPITPESSAADLDIGTTFDFDFQDIDWSFWSSTD